MTKAIDWFKLALDNKWVVVLLVGLFTGTATNADRLFKSEIVEEVTKEVKEDVHEQVHKQVNKTAQEFKAKYEKHAPLPHRHVEYQNRLKQLEEWH